MPTDFQRNYGINTDNFCKGLGNVCLNGAPIGATRAGAAVSARLIGNADLDIECAQYDGDLLGVRNGGRIWEITVTGMEVSLINLRNALDLQSSPTVDGTLPIGRPQKLARQMVLTIYGEAPQQRTRKWGFHRAVIVNAEEILMAGDREFSTAPMKFRIAADATYEDAWCYGVISDFTG